MTYFDFTLGIVVGIVLSIFTAYLSNKFAEKSHVKGVKGFVADQVRYISLMADNLEKERVKSDVIERDYLDLIDGAIIIFGRNRERISMIKDTNLKNEVLDFFTHNLISTIKARNALDRYNRRRLNNAITQDLDYQRTDDDLAEAKRHCDFIRDFTAKYASSLILKLS